jgi:cytochrome P450
MGRVPFVLISDPEIIQQLTVEKFEAVLNRHPPFRPRETTSLTFAQDETWRRIRRTVSPTFTSVHLKTMVPFMNESINTMLDKLDQLALSGEPCNIQKVISSLTFEIIGM